MTDNLKLVGTPEQPAPEFPRTNIQLSPNGLAIITSLASGLAITQLIAPEHLDQIARDWRALRKEQANQLDMIRHIEKSKIH